jgi:hypothetical protein
VSKSKSPKIEPIIQININKKKSPILLIKNILKEAFKPLARSDQKFTKNKEVSPIPSQPK